MPTPHLPRRSVLTAAAWTAPVVVAVSATRAFAGSGTAPDLVMVFDWTSGVGAAGATVYTCSEVTSAVPGTQMDSIVVTISAPAGVTGSFIESGEALPAGTNFAGTGSALMTASIPAGTVPIDGHHVNVKWDIPASSTDSTWTFTGTVTGATGATGSTVSWTTPDPQPSASPTPSAPTTTVASPSPPTTTTAIPAQARTEVARPSAVTARPPM